MQDTTPLAGPRAGVTARTAAPAAHAAPAGLSPRRRRRPPVGPSSTTVYSLVPSPVGEWMLRGRRGVLTGIFLAGHERGPRPEPGWVRDDDELGGARRQLDEYFSGTRRSFDVDLDLEGTAFQRRVWGALLTVPYGETASYGEIAEEIGSPGAARAVGSANSHNPVSIVVPCHRVIGFDGTLGGYGWGTSVKAWLLDHERRHAGRGLQDPRGLPQVL